VLETRVPDATTVVLVRDGAQGPEVFMALRSEGADFHGGAYVFPGGRVEDEDASLGPRCAGMHERDRERLIAENLTEDQALGCWVAALRELFEEVGVLLACRDGVPLDFSDPAIAERFGSFRQQLAAKELTFPQLVQREDLTLATDRLRYFSRYVTPPYAPKRFDTRFVIAVAPTDQLPAHDAFELVSGEWLTAGHAIAMYHAGERQIVPPTLQNLCQIAEAISVDDLLSRCDAKPITPICPSSVRRDGVFTLIYPGDLDYMPCLEPGFTSLDARGEDMPILRFRLERDGRWDAIPGVPRKGATMTTMEERLHRLEAIAEIKELTARYCLHVSRNEGEAVVDLFTSDGVLDGSTAGMGVIRGRDQLSAFYKQAVSEAEESLPFIHNHIIEVSGDDASGTCALEARFSRSGRSITAAGHYEDTYRRVDGRWLFAERKLFFNHMVPLSAGWAESSG
jgi:8-oxo-dGTP pyrophosphatase MutT (NUDIX family)/ketosteroid isomerase-like protein